jgi:hypothetical protein
LDRVVELLASVPLMIEYEGVLMRAGTPGSEWADIGRGERGQVAIPIPLRFLWETAVNGGADRLVTFNVRHPASAARDFGIRAVRPIDAWKEIQRHETK